jgi:peptidoglycan/xylan/chitin deacetylase (PgdA/CDA1 family)
MPRLATAVLAAAALALAGALAAPAAHAAPVTVTLEFDDGLAEHAQAAQTLQAHGLRGVFYINSGRLDTPGYLTTAQALAIQAAGHEIGGHTLTHQHLPSLPEVEQRREICDDRVALLNAGFKVENLAYPFGDSSPGVEAIAAACGYNSARITSGIRSPAGCSSCPWAESLTPPDVYAMRIPQSVRTATTLATIEGYVTGARDHGGGWIQILMHHLCDGGPACDDNSITPANLDALAAWLRAQPDVAVRSVAKVIDGPRKAGVPGPPRPAPSGAANVLANPSLESGGATDATCWRPSAYKTTDGVWSPTTSARTGDRAWRLDVSTVGTGAANRLLSVQDNGFCAPSATVGARYRVGAWVTGTAPVRLSAYRRATTATWSSWTSSPESAGSAAPGWRHVEWTTPAVPADTTSLSVGVSSYATGSLVVDDLELARVAPAVDAPPAIAITAPAAGATLADPTYVETAPTDDQGVARVRFYVDGAFVGSRTTAPWRWKLALAGLAPGSHTLGASAEDGAGQVTRGSDVTVTVP